MEVNLHFVLYEDLSEHEQLSGHEGLSAPADESRKSCESQRHAIEPQPCATEPERHATDPSAAETVAHITIIRGTNPADVDFDLDDAD